MESKKRFLWYVFLMAIFVLPLSGCSLSNRTNSYEEARSIAEEAYIFAFPMLENYRAMQVQAIAANNFNTFRHATELQRPGQQDVFRPHNDTLSSTLWLDLRAEPMVLTVPPISDRYYSFQFVDMYTHNFAYVSPRTSGSSGGRFLIAGPDWKGEKPRGVDAVLRSEGNFVFCLGRTAVGGSRDLENVRALQRLYHVQPLSAFLGVMPPKASSMEDFPFYMKIAADSAHFINYLNFMLGNLARNPTEDFVLERFGLIGIGPSFRFNASDLGEKIRKAVEDGIISALEQISSVTPLLAEKKNGWNLSRRVFGDRERMQGLFLIRAGVAKTGRLYGGDLEEVCHHTVDEDEGGESLDASKQSYRLVFSKDELPQVDAFWSLTMYSMPEQSLVDNHLDRYSIGNHRTSSLRFGADGSLTLYLQKDSPGEEKEGNWLPAPDGPFSLSLRMYLPKEEALPPFYVPPPVRKARDR